jgi:tRNA G18 (ribose-2'-O)-methylase SpoU
MRKLKYEEIFEKRPSLAELSELPRYPIYGLLENVRSLYNIGSVFRTSDAVRLAGLYLTGYTGRPPRREIDKTALGAVESVAWQHYDNPVDAVNMLRSKGVQILALEHTTESSRYDLFSYTFPLCVMFGNEVDGLSEEVVKIADSAIEIPMYGIKQSLNISVSYGIVMYHILNQFLQIKTMDKSR